MTDDQNNPYILCSECEAPVYYDNDTGEHACLGCDGDDAPDGWRMLSQMELLDKAGEFR